MERWNQLAVSASTAYSSSQNSLTGVAASSSQNSLKGGGAASSSKNSTTSGGGGKVAVTKRSVLTLERKLEIISEVKKGKSVRQCLDSLVFQNLQWMIFGHEHEEIVEDVLQEREESESENEDEASSMQLLHRKLVLLSILLWSGWNPKATHTLHILCW